MYPHWERFRNDETGAVTVDWVVLTAAIVGIGILMLGPIAFSADSSANGLSSYVGDIHILYGSD